MRKSFEAKTIKSDGCWEWIGTKNNQGYGAIRYNGKMIPAHRASWILHNGSIPDGLYICHKCDIRSCVNISHLFLGTHADNMRDMKEKGRQKSFKGEAHSNSKLTTEQVIEIKKLLAQNMGIKRMKSRAIKNIAKQFNVSSSIVSRIKYGETWFHVLIEQSQQ